MAPRKAKANKPVSKPKTIAKSNSKSQKGNARPKDEMPYSSQAERKRRQPTCSMASLRNLEDEAAIEGQFIGLFNTHSDNHYTWGKTAVKPIIAIKRRAKKPIQLTKKDLQGFPKGFFPTFEEGSPEPIIPNSADHSPFLRLPLEIREEIYAISLIFKFPVILQHDWKIVENKTYRKKRNNSLVFVCKQINTETVSFLYKNNVFRTILRPPPSNVWRRETFSVEEKFLPLFKNVIITCEKESYDLEWLEKACTSIRKLSEANVALETLTIVTYPQEVGLSDTAVGMEAHPITFADFFYSEGQFMLELRKLRCRFLNIIMKKMDMSDMNVETRKRRMLICVDMRYLHQTAIREGPLSNRETINISRRQADVVERELKGLKDRFEEVFNDDHRAMEEGKCLELDEHETCNDGMSLAADYFRVWDEAS